MQKIPVRTFTARTGIFCSLLKAAPPRRRPDQCFSGTAIDVIAMTMMAAMAQIETIIFFIVLVLFVSFLYQLHSCVRAGPVLIRRCMRPPEPVLFL